MIQYIDRVWLLTIATCGLIAGGVPCTAAEVPAELQRQQDLLVLGPLEPIRLRLLIEVDGIPFRTVWNSAVDRIIDQFDTDHDGKLTAEQSRQVASFFGAGATFKINANEGAISRSVLRERIERDAPPVTIRQRLSSGGAGPALVPLLDANGDGRLSREELRFADQSLHCRDFNDDQLIIEQELLAGPSVAASADRNENSVSDGSVILLAPGMTGKAVADLLLARYDRDRDGTLSLKTPSEVLSTDGRISSLDRNGNQALDREELSQFISLPLDAVLPFTLGGGAGASQKQADALPQYKLRSKRSDGGYRLQVGASEINFRRNNRDPSQDNSRPRLQDFDADQNKYLDETEFANVPDRPELAVVDTSKDGKVTEDEFDAYFLQRAKAAAVQLVLEITDKGSDLFAALDRNSDRVLSPRELHQAEKLLETEDRDHDGYLGGVEMSYNLMIEVSRGGSRQTTNAMLAMRGSVEPHARADTTGPTWFVKMDRNRDGDLSLAEFTGDRELFLKLDRDADGLISPDEVANLPQRQ